MKPPTRMSQADGQKLESRKMVSAQLVIERQNDKPYNIVAEVLDIGERRQCILGLSVTVLTRPNRPIARYRALKRVIGR